MNCFFFLKHLDQRRFWFFSIFPILLILFSLFFLSLKNLLKKFYEKIKFDPYAPPYFSTPEKYLFFRLFCRFYFSCLPPSLFFAAVVITATRISLQKYSCFKLTITQTVIFWQTHHCCVAK